MSYKEINNQSDVESPNYVVRTNGGKRRRVNKGWGTVIFVLIVAITVVAGAVFIGLRQEDEELLWDKCKNSKQIELVKEYLDRYPNGEHRSEARHLYALLVNEESQWKQASYGNDEYLLRSFISNFPESKYIEEAKSKLDDLMWDKAKTSNKAEAVEDYMREFTGGKHYQDAQKLLDQLQENAVDQEIENRIVAVINTFLSGMEKWDVAQMKCVCAGKLDNFMGKSGGLELVDEYFQGMKQSDVDTVRFSKLENVKITKIPSGENSTYKVSFNVNRSLARRNVEKGTFAKMIGDAVVNEEFLFTTLNMRKEPTMSGE